MDPVRKAVAGATCHGKSISLVPSRTFPSTRGAVGIVLQDKEGTRECGMEAQGAGVDGGLEGAGEGGREGGRHSQSQGCP